MLVIIALRKVTIKDENSWKNQIVIESLKGVKDHQIKREQKMVN